MKKLYLCIPFLNSTNSHLLICQTWYKVFPAAQSRNELVISLFKDSIRGKKKLECNSACFLSAVLLLSGDNLIPLSLIFFYIPVTDKEPIIAQSQKLQMTWPFSTAATRNTTWRHKVCYCCSLNSLCILQQHTSSVSIWNETVTNIKRTYYAVSSAKKITRAKPKMYPLLVKKNNIYHTVLTAETQVWTWNNPSVSVRVCIFSGQLCPVEEAKAADDAKGPHSADKSLWCTL